MTKERELFLRLFQMKCTSESFQSSVYKNAISRKWNCTLTFRLDLQLTSECTIKNANFIKCGYEISYSFLVMHLVIKEMFIRW